MLSDEQNRIEHETHDQSVEEEMRERYEEQQRRLACPSCGEEAFTG
ncbi:hypothetical protein Pr1d_24000 [Bythopirellula goksoeyrii]|uniref:Uncharacterized protein n=1 Tax=Bythopirellula goksoeyrii TaxID=1400387 RepID=A0A5B9QBF8_9BACT|nr:hypothetical protein Pr1d_24000 [Bythopirellula goksoeyrii]